MLSILSSVSGFCCFLLLAVFVCAGCACFRAVLFVVSVSLVSLCACVLVCLCSCVLVFFCADVLGISKNHPVMIEHQSGHPESNQGPSDCRSILQSDALLTELWPALAKTTPMTDVHTSLCLRTQCGHMNLKGFRLLPHTCVFRCWCWVAFFLEHGCSTCFFLVLHWLVLCVCGRFCCCCFAFARLCVPCLFLCVLLLCRVLFLFFSRFALCLCMFFCYRQLLFLCSSLWF